MKFSLRGVSLAAALCLTACSQERVERAPAPEKPAAGTTPQIVVGDVDHADRAALSAWIEEAVTLFKSPDFEANMRRAGERFPEVYLSRTEDIISTQLLLKRLKTEDPYLSGLWWPKTYVVLQGETAVRSKDRFGFGFEGSRKAVAGPNPNEAAPQKTGRIELGRLHLARYSRGDAVEKSCAINTLAHEISHTLSERPERYWMHILDSERHTTPPRGIYEASYFIGVVAQCTYLETVGRITPAAFESCMMTFSDPSQASRFRSAACDDFPEGKPLTPQGRLPLN